MTPEPFRPGDGRVEIPGESAWRGPGFMAQVVRIAVKDLAIEWKSREILATSAFLAVVVVLIFSFAFVVGGVPPSAPVIAGILWVAIIISGTVGLGRTFDRERDGEAIRALLLSPVPRGAIYAGKLLATIVLMAAVESLVAVLGGVFFSASLVYAGRIVLLLGLGTLGFAAVGCVFSAALLRSKSRDVLLSTLLYPIIVPILIAGARGTAHLLDPTPDLDAAVFWTQFMLSVDVIFLVVGFWAFEPVIAGD
ncbi:MAG: heme exporter protein CcmB [Deltaproteobacteria bacterium]|nr:heme exporter protein CcmB [Deltaproteobacteria bacterium]